MCVYFLLGLTERRREMQFLNRISFRPGNRLRELSLSSQIVSRDVRASIHGFLARRCGIMELSYIFGQCDI